MKYVDNKFITSLQAAMEKRPVSQLQVYDHCHKSRKGEDDYVDKKYKQVRVSK